MAPRKGGFFSLLFFATLERRPSLFKQDFLFLVKILSFFFMFSVFNPVVLFPLSGGFLSPLQGGLFLTGTGLAGRVESATLPAPSRARLAGGAGSLETHRSHSASLRLVRFRASPRRASCPGAALAPPCASQSS
mgnify:CR=1 FL=1